MRRLIVPDQCDETPRRSRIGHGQSLPRGQEIVSGRRKQTVSDAGECGQEPGTKELESEHVKADRNESVCHSGEQMVRPSERCNRQSVHQDMKDWRGEGKGKGRAAGGADPRTTT